MNWVWLPSDILLWFMVGMSGVGVVRHRQYVWLLLQERAILQRLTTQMALALLIPYLIIGLLDSIHFSNHPQAVEVHSVLDYLLKPLSERREKTYSAPFSTHSFAKETRWHEGQWQRNFPALRHVSSDQSIATLIFKGSLSGLLVWIGLAGLGWRYRQQAGWRRLWYWLGGWCLGFALLISLAPHYHVLGTDKVGQDVLWLTLKSIRTSLMIGCITTLVSLPPAIILGLSAGYWGGWVDDAIQYVYTTLSAIPGILLLAASALLLQTWLNRHGAWFQTVEIRADAQLLTLCLLLGLTGWVSLCRLLRAEALRLRSVEFVQAARAFGVNHWQILWRHIVPNVSHLVVLSAVMDFSGLVLAEAILSYLGVGVDPSMQSFGNLINAARLEMAREPVVWWPLASAFMGMLGLVLGANWLADALQQLLNARV